MTSQELALLDLGIPLNARVEIILNAGLEWIAENTTIDTKDTDNFPSCAKLFLITYHDIQQMKVGVASESIEGLSLSFNSSDRSALLWQSAEELLGNYLKGRVRFVSASRRWN